MAPQKQCKLRRFSAALHSFRCSLFTFRLFCCGRRQWAALWNFLIYIYTWIIRLSLVCVQMYTIIPTDKKWKTRKKWWQFRAPLLFCFAQFRCHGFAFATALFNLEAPVIRQFLLHANVYLLLFCRAPSSICTHIVCTFTGCGNFR